MVSLNKVFYVDVCDPFNEIIEFWKIEKEKDSCKTKEDQINFMYKYYSANAITIRELALDYDKAYSDLHRFNSIKNHFPDFNF